MLFIFIPVVYLLWTTTIRSTYILFIQHYSMPVLHFKINTNIT